MYSQATVARRTFKENEDYYSPFPGMSEKSDDDFDISSPIIDDFKMPDATSSANQSVDLNTDTNPHDVTMSKTSVNSENIFQTEQSETVSANMGIIPPKVDQAVSGTVKKSAGSMPKTAAARKSISGLDLEKRKEILNSFKPKVYIKCILLLNL